MHIYKLVRETKIRNYNFHGYMLAGKVVVYQGDVNIRDAGIWLRNLQASLSANLMVRLCK